MPEPSDEVWYYFTPHKATFWKWSDDQQAVVWLSGETIALRIELALLFKDMVAAAVGLPPPETLLLIIAACRRSASKMLPTLEQFFELPANPQSSCLRVYVKSTVKRLGIVGQLPEDIRGKLDGKRAILALVCENGPDVSPPEFTVECENWLRQGYSIQHGPPLIPPLMTSARWTHLYRGFSTGLFSINETAVRLRMDIGLETVVVPPPIPLPLPEPATTPDLCPIPIRDLLAELERDEQHSGLARLAKRLLSVVTMPRPVSSPDDQPLGGVSDISNRGSFDRLLLSELAHDVDVLMTRVALNEALYIRREVPPTIPPRNRLILLDAGIRMWGVPRLYATAVALALAVTQDESVSTRVFRAAGECVGSVDLTSRADLIEHLGTLELPVHPGASVPAFLSESDGVAADNIIATSDEVLADPEFRRVLANHKIPNLYVAVVSREGDFRLIQRTRQGERIVRQAKLDLDQILAPTSEARAKPNLIDPTVDPSLPAILRVRPFPLQLPHRIDWNRSRALIEGETKDAFWTISPDRRLTLWTSKKQFGRQLCDRIPDGVLYWSSPRPNKSHEIQLLVGYPVLNGELSLVTVALNGNCSSIVRLKVPKETIEGVCEHAGTIYVTYKSETHLFGTSTGEFLSSVEHGSANWIKGRFFRVPNACLALCCNGRTAEWETVLTSRAMNLDDIKSVFYCVAYAAPVVVAKPNRVFCPGSNTDFEFKSTYLPGPGSATLETNLASQVENHANYQVADVSPDGCQFVLKMPSGMGKPTTSWLVDLRNKTATESHYVDLSVNRELTNQRWLRGNPRRKLGSIGVYANGLVFISDKQKVFGFALKEFPRSLVLVPLSAKRDEISQLAQFQAIAAPDGIGFGLKRAQWSDGSSAYLDTRGLLHLVSSDSAIPEMTFVLNDSNVAGWCDRNRVWGDIAFTGSDREHVNVEYVYQEWLIPFCARLS